MKNFGSERGSALVGTMALSVILSLGASGFLLVAGNTMQDESLNMEDEKAFQAAESGLLMGSRWLRAFNAMPNFCLLDIFNANPLSVNGMAVRVNIHVHASYLTIEAIAGSDFLPYQKKMSWRARRRENWDGGTFINHLEPEAGISVGGEGLNNVLLDGPTHINEPVIISSVSNGGNEVKFCNGRLSVYNYLNQTEFDKHDAFNSGDWGEYGQGVFNDYTYGVFQHNLKQHTEKGADLDQFFSEGFLHSQDSMVLGPPQAPDTVLPLSTPHPGDNDQPRRRSTLIFQADGSADYYTWSRNGNNWTANHFTLTASAINGKMLRVQGDDVNVMGVLNGQVSVMTDPGFSIFPTGDLVYAGFSAMPDNNYLDRNNENNYGIGDANTSILGLVTGEDLFFGPEWIDPVDGVTKNVVGGSGTNLYFMAMLVARETDGTVMWRVINNNNHKIRLQDYHYDLRYIGSRTLDRWFNYTAGGSNANSSIVFCFDIRIAEGLAAPKLPGITCDWNGQSLSSLVLSGWGVDNMKN